MTHNRTLSIVAILMLSLALAGCGGDTSSNQPGDSASPADTQAPADSTGTEVTELIIEDLTVGEGAEATDGSLAVVHYTGWLTDGTEFDSSKNYGKPFEFTVGAREVIAGWDQGVKGMKVGGVRKLTIPAELGYGAQGAGGVIPPNATLIFEVELVEVR